MPRVLRCTRTLELECVQIGDFCSLLVLGQLRNREGNDVCYSQNMDVCYGNFAGDNNYKRRCDPLVFKLSPHHFHLFVLASLFSTICVAGNNLTS